LLSKSVKNSLEGGKRAKTKAKATTKTNAIDQSFRLRLHSGLRQSGGAFGVVFYGTAEAVPFRLECVGPLVRKG
jgi:hypothetical protein